MGEHAVFIWASYATAGVVLIALAIHIWRDGIRQQALLSRLEQDGAGRRLPARTSAIDAAGAGPDPEPGTVQAEGS